MNISDTIVVVLLESMRKLLLIVLIIFLSVGETFAYAVKVYDQYGNRVGTYRKEGDKYVLYDFNDNKVENPEEVIKNPPSQRTLSEFTQTLYDENMMPIGNFTSGLYGSDGVYYPRGWYIPRGWRYPRHNYIVRPSATFRF
jgi:hypothetical protein